jgi:2-oxoglutarate ferredoxin oxidoreductase subunit alpha
MTKFGTNDFVLRFANINGTGSATANGLVAKCLFRMGLPIGPKNMFPSNIQGLPTWYEIRVNDKGYIGRRGGVDLMVAMNPQTMAKDLEDIVAGGYVLYDSTKQIRDTAKKPEINYLEIPITEICRSHFSDPKQRTLLKNIVYVGALISLLGLDRDVLRQLLQEQIGHKKHLFDANIKALELGNEYAVSNFPSPLPLNVRKGNANAGKIMIEGNTAAGLGCVFGGATVAAWYPITPSTSLVDAFEKYCEKFRIDDATKTKKFAIVQAEDEIAAIGMTMGAQWMGARAFTATSGPGVSLMTEFLGFAYYAEIPLVLFDIQRVGPSTGMPTRTQQSDLLSCAFASHGDTKHILLFPAHPGECFDFGAKAFDYADRYQTPVIVMSDLELGMNEWISGELKWDDNYAFDRGKILSKEDLDKATQPFYRYLDVDGDGVPYRTLPYTHPSKGAFLTRGSGHDKFGRYTEDEVLYQENMDRLTHKFYGAAARLPAPILRKAAKATKTGVVCTGTLEEPLREALDMLGKEGMALDYMRIRAFPFHSDIKKFIDEHDQIIVIDQNRDAQLRSLLITETDTNPAKILSVRSYGGMPATALELSGKIKACGAML